jgi:hypothetical protein
LPRTIEPVSWAEFRYNPTELRNTVRDRRGPLVIVDQADAPVALILPHWISYRIESRLPKLTDYYRSDSFDDPEEFEQLQASLARDGMVRFNGLGDRATSIYWSSLLTVTPEHFDLLFEDHPGWWEAFDWRDIVGDRAP